MALFPCKFVFFICKGNYSDFRPAADDVIVLKQELISVQTLMDNLTQEREKEKEDLEKEYNSLKVQYNMYVAK